MKFRFVPFIFLLAGSLVANDTNPLAVADLHYANREKMPELLNAIDGYEILSSQDSPSYEAAWKLSKAFWYRGNHSGANEKQLFFEKGMAAGMKATSLDPGHCEGYFWLGINTALLAESSGKFKALGLVDDIKASLNRAMSINENCECGGPQRVLGKLYTRLPFFKGGSKNKAIEYLKKSLDLCPNDTQSRIFLAEIYADQNKKDLAVQQLNLVLQQSPDPQWIPETKENKIIAEKMLLQLRGNR